MSEPDYDDPATEERWCAARREEVVQYLRKEKVDHGRVGDWPAWHVAPYVSVWAIESKARPGWVGWWVICGDLPTDYVSSASIRHPRAVLEAVATRWRGYVAAVRAGTPPQDFTPAGMTEAPDQTLDLLERRADMLAAWAADDEIWEGV
jgi:hypothetical protein